MSRSFSRNDVLSVADKYLKLEMPACDAIGEAHGLGVFGLRVAGEIALEEAHKDTVGAEYWLTSAQRYFELAVMRGEQVFNGPNREVINAQSRLLHLPLVRPIILEENGPEQATVEDAYDKTVKLGRSTLNALNVRSELRSRNISSIFGRMTELAVHALALRTALKVGPDTWLPVQSKYSEDNENNCSRPSSGSAWDLSILESDDVHSGLRLKHKIQIKAKRATEDKDHVKYAEDVVGLHVNPDLKLWANDGRIGRKILIACGLERDPEVASGRLTSELDRREKLFLGKIDE